MLRFGPQRTQRIGNDEALAKAISPTEHLSKDSPPTLILFGTADWLLGQGEEFMKKAKELGHRAELFTAEGQRRSGCQSPAAAGWVHLQADHPGTELAVEAGCRLERMAPF